MGWRAKISEAQYSSCLVGGTALSGASANAFTGSTGVLCHNLQVTNSGGTACLVQIGTGPWWCCRKTDVTTFSGIDIEADRVRVHRVGDTTTGNFAGVYVSAW